MLGLEIGLGFLVFTGSLMAAGKLQELLPQRPITYPFQNAVNFAVLGAAPSRSWWCSSSTPPSRC